MAELTPTQWIAQCTNRLQLRQHTLYRMQWEEGGIELWREARWPGMAPAQAAGEWLQPVDAAVGTALAGGVMEAAVP